MKRFLGHYWEFFKQTWFSGSPSSIKIWLFFMGIPLINVWAYGWHWVWFPVVMALVVPLSVMMVAKQDGYFDEKDDGPAEDNGDESGSTDVQQ